MIKNNDKYECSKCGQEIILKNRDVYCRGCGRVLSNPLIRKDEQNKHIAADYREARFKGQDVVIAEIHCQHGYIQFMVPEDSQIAYRVKYFVENRIKTFLEDGLIGDTPLFDMTKFEQIYIGSRRFIVDKRLL